MIREVGINVFRFIFLVFLQLFVLNNIQFSGFVNPYMYIMFIMLLPFEIAGWLMLILAFFTGLVIDVASTTFGYHTIATVFMAYLRTHLLRYIAPHDGYEQGMSPTISSLGLTWSIKYVSILTLTHHILLFLIESFRFSDFLFASLRALASSILTVLLIIIYQFFVIRSK